MKIPSLRILPLGLLPLGLALLAGCESNPERHAVEEARRSVPPMAANDTFFDGKIAASITLGSSLAESRAPGSGPGGKGPRAGGGHMHGGGGRHGGAGMGGGSEGSDSDAPQEIHARYVDSPMPPALLRVRLENKSTEAITVEIHDLNSELGNFATRPDKFTIEPGMAGEPNAMQSLLGLDSLALPVTLVLKVDGKLETKVLTLRPINPAPDAKPASP